MICIYHSKDLDGLSSGAIVKRRYPDCQLIGWDYGQPIPELPAFGPIIMVDVTFPIPIMRSLINRLTVMDHHKSFIEEWEKVSKYDSTILLGKREIGKAGCLLTWEYLFPGVGVPRWVEYLSDYDIWKGSDTPLWELVILPFQYGMRSFINHPSDFFKHDLDYDEIIRDGKAILAYIAQNDLYNCQRNSFVIDFEGLRTICLNTSVSSTGTFKSIYNPQDHDLMLGFNYSGKFWNISLRSTGNVDCSALAKKHGGGGHALAAGFQVVDINELICTHG